MVSMVYIGRWVSSATLFVKGLIKSADGTSLTVALHVLTLDSLVFVLESSTSTSTSTPSPFHDDAAALYAEDAVNETHTNSCRCE